jgi:hypothetical protein
MLKYFTLLIFFSCNSQFELGDHFKKYHSLNKRCEAYKIEVLNPLLHEETPKLNLIEKMNPNLTNAREYLGLKYKLHQWLKKNEDVATFKKWNDELKICFPISDELKILEKLKKVIQKEKNQDSQIVMRKVYEYLVYYHAIKNPDPQYLLFVIEVFLELKEDGHFQKMSSQKVEKIAKKVRKLVLLNEGDPVLNLDDYIKKIDRMYKDSSKYKHQLLKEFKAKKKK